MSLWTHLVEVLSFKVQWWWHVTSDTASSSQDRVFEECLVCQAERRVWEIKFLYLEPPDLAFVSKAKVGCYKHLSILRKCSGHQAMEPAGRAAVLLASSLLLTHVAIYMSLTGMSGLANVFVNHLCNLHFASYSGCRFSSYFSSFFFKKTPTPTLMLHVTCINKPFLTGISNNFQAVGCVRVRMVYGVV